MTIYDASISIQQLPGNVGTLAQGKPVEVFNAFCGELTVYHARYWESVQAGSRIEAMVEMPLHRDVEAGMYAFFKNHMYLINQVQFAQDEFLCPITVLSLTNPENAYDFS